MPKKAKSDVLSTFSATTTFHQPRRETQIRQKASTGSQAARERLRRTNLSVVAASTPTRLGRRAAASANDGERVAQLPQPLLAFRKQKLRVVGAARQAAALERLAYQRPQFGWERGVSVACV